MIRHGNPPYLECSGRGDKRFSAFYARIKGRENKSIEQIYQAAKRFPGGLTGLNIQDAKGKHPINYDEVRALYATLWDEYIAENPELVKVLVQASGLSDLFGQHGHVCQATELWRIRQNHIIKESVSTVACPECGKFFSILQIERHLSNCHGISSGSPIRSV